MGRRMRMGATSLTFLKLTESGLEVEEVNVVAVVQEIVEITVESGAAKGVWPIRQKGAYENKGDEDSEVGGSHWQSDACGRRCETGIRTGRQEVQHEVLGR